MYSRRWSKFRRASFPALKGKMGRSFLQAKPEN